jgi:hypothetical protein
MKIDEITLLKVTLPSKKEMKALDYWNLNRKSRAALKSAIHKCLQSGDEQILRDDGVFVYIVKPRFPLIDSAMKEPQNADYLKVSISVFTQIRTLGVKIEEEDDPATKGFLWNEIQAEAPQGLSRVND